MVDSALDLFRRRRDAGHPTVLVFYRGERSFFCKQWLRRWLSIPGIDRRLDLADVFVLFVSSQSQGKAFSVADQIAGRKPILDSRVFFFGDPEHLLVDYLAEVGLTRPVVTNPDSHRAHGWVFDYGMVQPAVLAVAPDSSVLYEWASKPTLLNVAGKLDRPDPWDVWDKIEYRIDRIRITNARAQRKALAVAATTAPAPFPPTSPDHHATVTQSHPRTAPEPLDAYASVAHPLHHHPQPHPENAATATTPAHLSMHSLASSHLAPMPQSPLLAESAAKPPLSAHRHHPPAEVVKPATPDSPKQRREDLNNHYPNVVMTTAPADSDLRHIPSESDIPTAPPSTAIDTFTVDALKNSLAKEEPDVSEEDIHNIRVQQLSASINALATEVLGENSLSAGAPQPQAVARLPTLAEKVVLNQQQHHSEPLTDDDSDHDLDDVADGEVTEEDIDDDENVRVHDDLEDLGRPIDDGLDDEKGFAATATEVVHTDLTTAKVITVAVETADCVEDESIVDQAAVLQVAAESILTGEPDVDRGVTLDTAAEEADGAASTTFEAAQGQRPASDVKNVRLLDPDLLRVSQPGEIPVPDKHVSVLTYDNVAAANVNINDVIVDSDTDVVDEDPSESDDLDAEDLVVDDLAADDLDDDDDFETATSKASGRDSMQALQSGGLLDAQSSGADPLETSVASVGSDHVDSSALISKHASVRTEDSMQVNTLNYEGNSFPSERRIPEEADDRKTGISDYLKELKDSSRLKDPRYRSRYDPLPPIKASGRLSVGGPISRHRPTSVSGYSHAKDMIINSNVALTQGLIQQETSHTLVDSAQRASMQSTSGGPTDRILPSLLPDPRTHPSGMASGASVAQVGSPHPGTASPHPESQDLPRSSIVDVSPFADADLDLNGPDEGPTKSSLRDEYEAYDEYIVCEYEVEEYVEEYESDAFSKSKVFVTTVLDDSSQGESLATNSAGGPASHSVQCFDPSKVVDVKGTSKETDPERNLKVWKDENGRVSVSPPVLAPAIQASMIMHERESGAPSHSIGPVRKVLRKIRVPVISVGRRPLVRSGEESKVSQEAEGPAPLTRDSSRVSRKDTLRAVLRKMPAGMLTSGGELEEGPTDEPSPPLQRPDDEQTAKLGRKETIKSVLRKIPVPKNIKRAQTVEGVVKQEGVGGLDGVGQRADGTDKIEESTGRLSKRGGLQAVLQRLPSLSGGSRGPRSSARLAPSQSERNIGTAGYAAEASAAKQRNRGVAMAEAVSTVSAPAATEATPAGPADPTRTKAHFLGDTPSAENGVAPAKLGLKTTPVSTTDKESGWASDSDSERAAARARGTESGCSNDTGVSVKRGKFQRTLSRLVQAGGLAADDKRNDATEETSGAGGVGSGGLEGRRVLRWNRREEEGEESEKVSPKMSFALVGGRILSRFKTTA